MQQHLHTAGIFLDDEEHLKRIQVHFEHVHLILIDEQAVGMLKYWQTDNEIKIAQLQLMPSTQGKGLGKAILQDIMQQANELNLPVRLSVLKENPAKHLYYRLGFEQESEDQYEYYLCKPVLKHSVN
nr:GNAT family N-acetyltransferase [Neptunicella marina]